MAVRDQRLSESTDIPRWADSSCDPDRQDPDAQWCRLIVDETEERCHRADTGAGEPSNISCSARSMVVRKLLRKEQKTFYERPLASSRRGH
jgi:hypothetical protein